MRKVGIKAKIMSRQEIQAGTDKQVSKRGLTL